MTYMIISSVSKLTTFLMKLFEMVKTISGVAKDFTRLCYAAKLATQLQKSQLGVHDFGLEILLIIFLFLMPS